MTAGQENVIAAATELIGAMFPRPLAPAYPEISSILQRAIQSALLGSRRMPEGRRFEGRQPRARLGKRM